MRKTAWLTRFAHQGRASLKYPSSFGGPPTDRFKKSTFLKNARIRRDFDDYNHDWPANRIIPSHSETLKNLFEADSGFCISKVMIIEVVAAIFIFWMFKKFADIVRADKAPEGKGRNAFGVRGLHSRRNRPHGDWSLDGDKYVPMLGTVFFFILILNLIGMLPWIGAATEALTMMLTYMLIHAIYSGSKNLGSSASGPI